MPRDLSELASRATTSASTARALDDLDAWQRLVAEALAALPDPTTLADLEALVGGGPDEVVTAVDVLRARALAWGDDDALHLVRTARESVRPPPAGSRRALAAAARPRGGRRRARDVHPGDADAARPAGLVPDRGRPAVRPGHRRGAGQPRRRAAGRAAAALPRRRHRGPPARGRAAAARGSADARARPPPGRRGWPAGPGPPTSSTGRPPAPRSACSTTSTSSPAPSRTPRSARCGPAGCRRAT